MIRLLHLSALAALAAGCAAGKVALRPELEPLRFDSAATNAPAVLTENHFQRDQPTGLSETALREVLAAPVFLEASSRIGVVPVAERYEVDGEVPTTAVPASVVDALETSGMFELATEVSSDWPAARGLSGLRELAARYRADYVLLYRHRFLDQAYLNPWALGFLTVVGVPFVPGTTLEAAGVLEASLFDVKTGTILFTVYERVSGSQQENVWQNDRKLVALKRKLLEGASRSLSEQVVSKCRRLLAARPDAQKTLALEAPPST